MIEIVSSSRCIACDICVKVCPANVFDPVRHEPPVIARQDDCQTCFLCEIYCPTDALYVAPCAEGPTGINEAAVEAAALTATSRWAYASALAREESRGMQRRLDYPAVSPEYMCALEVSGFDRIDVVRSEIPGASVA